MNKLNVHDVLLIGLFFVCCIFVVFLRTQWSLYFEGESVNSGFSFFGCLSELRPCTRILPSILHSVSEYFAIGVSKLLFWNVAESLFFSGDPDAVIQINERNPVGTFKYATVPFIGIFIYILACLSSVYFFVVKFSDNVFTRYIFFIVLFYSILGWHPIIVNIFFNFITNFVEWPQYYFLYSEPYKRSDFLSLAFLLFSIHYLSTKWNGSLLPIAFIAAIAQATFEYLGVVMILTILLRHCLESEKGDYKSAFYRLFQLAAASGSGAIVTLILILIAGNLSGMRLMYDVNSDEVLSLAQLFLPEHNQRLAINLESWKILLAILVTMIAIPAIIGFFAGWLSALIVGDRCSLDLGVCRKIALVSLCVCFGYVVILIIGIFFIHYPSELGRQLMPLATISLIPFFVAGGGMPKKELVFKLFKKN